MCFIFRPLGFGTWQATVATVTGLIAKENVVSTFGVLFGLGADLTEEDPGLLAAVGTHFTALSAYSFMIFNLLCAPCFAAMGAIKRAGTIILASSIILWFLQGFGFTEAGFGMV